MANKPVPFFEAALALSDICWRVEEGGGEVDEVLLAEFGRSSKDLIESIDRRKALNEEINSKIELGKLRKKEAEARLKYLEKVQERLKGLTLDVIQSAPNIPYIDSHGKKLTACQSAPALKLEFELHNKSFLVLDPDWACMIDPKYVQKITFLTLDTAQIKADLVNGETLPWAKLQKTTYLRGL